MRKKGLAILVFSMIMSLACVFSSYAGEWKQDNVGWWWQESDGSYPTNQWRWLDGNADGVYEKYHFNSAGYLDVNTTLTDTDGTQVQVNADGAKLKSNNEVSVIRNLCEMTKDEDLLNLYNVYKSVKDNSEYMSEYSDLKPGAAFIYDNVRGVELYGLAIIYLDVIIGDTSEQFEYSKSLSKTDTYEETNYYADAQGQKPTLKFIVNESGDYSGGNSFRIFIYE